MEVLPVHRYIVLLGILFSAVLAGNKKSLSLETIFHSDAFSLNYIHSIQWLPDGSGLTYIKGGRGKHTSDIYLYDLKTKQENLLLKGIELKKTPKAEPLRFSAYQWMEDGRQILFKANEKKIWRHSTQAQYFIYDMKTSTFSSLIKGDPYVSNAKIAPDKKHVGYVKENNLYVYNTQTGQTRALTSDGTRDIINGQFDWVYEEEFAISDGWRWSPDGRHIAFWRLDATPEPTFSWVDFEPLNGKVETIRYPKAGQANALVQIGVLNIENGTLQWMDLGSNTDIYIPRMRWMNDSTLLIQRLNRLQNHLELLRADTRTGQTHVLIEENDPAWVDVHDNFFFTDESHFIWSSERSGFNHIYLVDARNGALKQLTRGAWEVEKVYGFDDSYIYFSANKEKSINWNIYRVHRKTGRVEIIGEEEGRHRARFSPDFKYFVDQWSNAGTPPQSFLKTSRGLKKAVLVENPIDLKSYGFIAPEFGTMTTSDGIVLNTRTFWPAGFDKHKKYPVVMYGYGGPGSQIVVNQWGRSRELWFSWLAQQGYIVFTLDNRGTGARGKAFKNLAYGDISKYAVADHIEGARYLASKPWVDKERIAIWGWSGGGYLTLNLMFRAADYFKVGMAVAPVSDFRLYDTIWTERYMGLPRDNKAGYDAANSLNYCQNLKGKLLIVHGTADDNVHIQNTMQLVKKLQQVPLQFDLMVYPGLNHALYGGNSYWHLFTMMSRYLKENL